MGTCSVCNESFKDEYFDAEQNKCILHCEKDDKNGWCSLDKKIWDSNKINLFWKYIQYDLDEKYNTHMIDSDLIEKEYILSNIIFPKFQDEVEYFSPANNEKEMGTNFYSYGIFEDPVNGEYPNVNKLFEKLIVSFDNCIFLDNANFEKYNFEHELLFNECKFESEIQLSKIYKNRVSFLACTIQNLNCQDIVFESFIDFASTTFENKVSFKNTIFEIGVSFVQCKFNNETDFTYTSFEGKTFFNEAKFSKEINLEKATFYEDVDFLKIETQVANRETARKIKDSFEKQNNIIEANKFYALEMQEREKELKEDIKEGKNIFEWLIFKAHALSSNHSQDWVLALLWILNIGLIFSMFISTFYHNNMLAYISILMVAVALKFNNALFKILISVNFIIFYWLSYVHLDEITDKINPFSIMTSKDPITFGLLLFKVTIAYLIYQFIVSVRQNTRRK